MFTIDGTEIVIRLQNQAKKRLKNTGLPVVYCEHSHGEDLIEVEARQMQGRVRHRFFINGSFAAVRTVHARPAMAARY